MEHLLSVVNALCEDVCTPRALAVKLLANSGEWRQLFELTCKPSGYSDSESYFKDSVVTEFLRKIEMELPGLDLTADAEATFFSCERKNKRANDRLSRYLPERELLEHAEEVTVADFISQWRKEVRSVLCSLPVNLHPGFGPGATFADTGCLTTIPDKMSSRPTVTADARCLLSFWECSAWARGLLLEQPHSSDPLTVRGNRFVTVPKKALQRRGICIEASINVGFQLDAGKLLKKCLRRIGIDLKEGQDKHRALAACASRDGTFATIDLRNASDTLCYVLVKLLLPGDWFSFLDSLRAPMTRVGDRWVKLEKFSSMGNGFTFELETIVFSTLARLIVKQEGGDPDLVMCYGDDLIVPVHHAKSLMAALNYFGFEPNSEKTFVDGPFRESCGGDFFDGYPVRAHYLKEIPDEPHKWISLANGIRRMAFGHYGDVTRWRYLRRAWTMCLSQLPSNIRRLRGPEHLGDVVIHDHRDWWTWDVPKNIRAESDGWDARYIKAWTPIPVILSWHHWRPAVQLASCTLSFQSTGVTPRGGISGFKISSVVSNLRSDWEPTQCHRTSKQLNPGANSSRDDQAAGNSADFTPSGVTIIREDSGEVLLSV